MEKIKTLTIMHFSTPRGLIGSCALFLSFSLYSSYKQKSMLFIGLTVFFILAGIFVISHLIKSNTVKSAYGIGGGLFIGFVLFIFFLALFIIFIITAWIVVSHLPEIFAGWINLFRIILKGTPGESDFLPAFTGLIPFAGILVYILCFMNIYRTIIGKGKV